MGDERVIRPDDRRVSRRRVIQALGAGAAATWRRGLLAQTPQSGPVAPPSTISNPPRDFGANAAPTTYFLDPDIVVVDPAFNDYIQPNAAITRVWTGSLWAEGPAWSGQGRFLVFSDIPNNRQLRYLDEDNHVSVYRAPSNYSNGNTIDFQGRQISCEHFTRRVVRYEHDGSVSILADAYNGKRFNAPNDVVAHPDGSYWFTDPPYGASLYEGQADAPGGPANLQGRINSRVGQPAGAGQMKRELPNAIYRLDANGQVTQVATEAQVPDPNGLAFSPDFKKLYVVSTGKGPGDTGAGGKGDLFVFDVGRDNTLANVKRFSDCVINGVNAAPDGVRCDVDGNLWCSSNAGRSVGYNGVTVWTPQGKLLGRIRLPEVCANLCFGGPKRNRLFMCASQSLYALYVNTQGAGPG
jgi:gluconolactonase